MLYETYLPIIQEINTYGGNPSSFHIGKPVLDAIDAGAATDSALETLQRKLLSTLKDWKKLQDHQKFSAFFEAYCEAVFYLVASQRGVALHTVKAGAGKGNTPDFQSVNQPTIGFEVKTIDVADPPRTYNKAMEEGLDAHLEAEAQAKKRGIGTSARIIAPHGNAKGWREVIEQVMKKIDGNIKSGQYASAPTFLVVSATRTSLHDRADELRKLTTADTSGQLFTVAAHQAGDHFSSFGEFGDVEDLGALQRNGILRGYPFIAGMIFLHTEWNLVGEPEAMTKAYKLNGIWNSAWETSFRSDSIEEAKKTFEHLCHAWNDTSDSRSHLL